MQLPQVARVLPGPAGKLQELAAAGALEQATPEMLGLKSSTGSSGMSASQAAHQHDTAFLSSSWAAAKAYAAEAAPGPICSVKSAKQMGVGKVPQMLLLMHTCHAAASGSAFSKVKDPTGIIGAALHGSALQQQPLLGPGCVLLLRNVSVLTPNPSSSYLAITADNIVKVWAPDQSGRSIRDTVHRPNPTQQQQQHPTQHQQQAHQTQHQQQRGAEGQPLRGPAGHMQRPGTAAAAASGADSRCSDSFLPPPSPDIMSVLNQVGGGACRAAAGGVLGAGGAAAAATQHQAFSRGIHQAQQQRQQSQQQGRQLLHGSQAPGRPNRAAGNSQQQQQQQPSQQQQWRQQQHADFSPALSGAVGQHAAAQQAPGSSLQRGSMPPPPPRVPHNSGLNTQARRQQSQQQSQHQQQSQQERVGQSLLKGLSQLEQPLGSQGPGRAPPPPLPPAAAASAAGVGSAPQHDVDVEVDENIVAAIFGSQVPKPVAPLQPPPSQLFSQQQQRQQQTHHQQQQQTQTQQPQVSAVSGAFRGAGSAAHTTPAASKQQLNPGNNLSSQQYTPGGLSQVHRGVSAAGATGALLGSAKAPSSSLLAVSQQQQQQQRTGGMAALQQQQWVGGTQGRVAAAGAPPAGGVRPGGFAGSLLGKRPMQVSLLDDLVADDLDDL